MVKKSLEQRVIKLEYHMRLMKEYVKDMVRYDFWEWVINYELDEYEVNQILNLTKSYNKKLKKNLPINFNEYYSEVVNIMKNNEELTKYISPIFVKQMLLSLRNLMFKDLIDTLLKEQIEIVKKY